jgi:WhiB family redox-sensing transcriptional regulator
MSIKVNRIESWRDSAACLSVPRSVFFPVNTRSTSQETRAALAICRSCPVRAECLNSAINNREYYGIWGGTTEATRRPMIDAALGVNV